MLDPNLYINRELSWLEFNARVLHEAFDARNPLLERLKFLAIFSTNLDEFYMVRVAGLRRQVAAGVMHGPPDGLTPQRTARRDHEARRRAAGARSASASTTTCSPSWTRTASELVRHGRPHAGRVARRSTSSSSRRSFRC